MRDLLATCLESLSRYRLRTALCVTGIALGIAAVVAMVSVGQGARADALRQVSQLGLQNVVVRYQSPAFDVLEREPRFGLTVGDAGRIRHLDGAAALVSSLREQSVTAAGERSRTDATVLAVESSYFGIMDLRARRGRVLMATDDTEIARVCVIGGALAETLFGESSPVGQPVRLNGAPYVVVGVLADRRHDGRTVGTLSPRSFDTSVLVPLGASVSHHAAADPWQRVDEIWIRAADGVDPAAAGIAVDRVLRAARRYDPDYEVIVPRELMQQQVRLRRTFDVVVGAIAIVTLLVGGIGVMNVMLTSVFERTSEIGLRRAVGATRTAIAGQFLLEAVSISVAGGVAGLLIGVTAALVIGSVGEWPTVVSMVSVMVGSLVSIGVGLVAGVYPARRAACLEPIEAVRYE